MKITYDPEADAIYILLHEAEPGDSLDVEDGVTVDLDRAGHIVGLEILDASKRLTPEELVNVSYENLLLAAAKVP
jgi:uncharacterized protein YuzE